MRIVVFEPHDSPGQLRMTRRRSAPNMTPGRAALVGLMDRYLRGLLDPIITLLEVHKLMYFMKVGGEPAMERLRVVKGRYGPYAENLTHVLREIEGHLILGYRDGGDAPHKQLELVAYGVDAANQFLEQHPHTRARFDRVVDLVAGFESAYGLELLSTVHWVISRENPDGLDDMISRFYAWNDRKRRFSVRQIRLAATVLEEKSWIDSDLEGTDR